MDDHGTETPREELALPPPTGKRRVMFHREDLKNKISGVVHRRSRAATEGAAEIAADLDSSLVEQRPKWFKKIFTHRRHSAGDALQPGSAVGDDEEPRTAASERADAAAASDCSRSSSSSSSGSSLSSAELARRSVDFGETPTIKLAPAKGCASPEGSTVPTSRTNRLKSRFRRLHTRSSNASNSSSHRSDESSRSPTSAKTPMMAIPLTRSNTTGTMLSNAGGMSRRSYRNKLDHALRKAHLTRRTYGLNPTTCGGGLDDSSGGGFMMKPDKDDQKKVQSSEAFQSVVLEAAREFSAHR